MSKRNHHYVVGAGMVGCMYDYGPEQASTKREAMEAAMWYLGDWSEVVRKADIRRMRSDLHNHGIHYFPARLREAGYGDYIEISRVDGPMEDNTNDD